MDSTQLLNALYAATTFEEATTLGLTLIEQAVRGALGGVKGSVQRAAILVREGEGPHGLRWRALDDPNPTARPSLTAERLVRERRAPVLLDVLEGAVFGQGPEASFQSREQLRERGVTHIVGLPLALNPNVLVGAATVELKTRVETLALRNALWPTVEALQPALSAVSRALAHLPRAPRAPEPDPELPVVGPEMAELLDQLADYADCDEIILLRGETGTGKTHLARWCHRRSPVREGPFLTVQLNNAPPELLAGELFGHAKGAYTGAHQAHRGFIARAAGGTLFIDELDKLDLRGQAMLLRLMDSGEYQPLGATGVEQASARLIVGTNAPLEALMASGALLPDLYYRICSLSVELPPLRERRQDIPGWARWFAREQGHKRGREVGFEDDALELLQEQDWRGNLRELDAVVLRAYLRAARGVGAVVHIRRTHIEHALGRGAPPPTADRALREAARAFLVEARRRGGLTLKDADQFRGFVLREGGQMLGVRETYELFGQEKAIEQGNHTRLYREQVTAAEELEGRLKKR